MQIALNKKNLYRSHRQTFNFKTPLVPTFAFVSFATMFLGIMQPDDLLKTLGLAYLVSTLGAILIAQTASKVHDPRVLRLEYVWAAKLTLTLVLLYVGWIPELDQSSSATWGYDAQRYYVEAKTLLDQGLSSDGMWVNYAGIWYYFAIIFFLFGYNPINPAIVNSFVTLCATLFLLRVGYWTTPARRPDDWRLGLAMILPDVLWFDCLTAREPLMCSVITVACLGVGRSLEEGFNLRKTIVFSLCILVIAAVRTSMLLAVIMIILIIQVIKLRRWYVGLILIIIAVVGIIFIKNITGLIGSTDLSLTDDVSKAVTGTTFTDNSGLQWSKNSLGEALIPQSPLHVLAFSPIRIIVNVASPLPTITFSFQGLLHGSYYDWQGLMSSIAALIYLGGFPLALAALIHFIKHRRTLGRQSCIHFSFWIVLSTISLGTYIIHDRYRVMASLLYWGCLWLGLRAPRRTINNCYVLSGLAGVAFALFFIAFKYRAIQL